MNKTSLYCTVFACALSACAPLNQGSQAPSIEDAAEKSSDISLLRPVARPLEGSANSGANSGPIQGGTAPVPARGARTAAQFDTTSNEERAKAKVIPTAAVTQESLGRTTASLGNPADPGFWLATPLVKTLSQGRVTYDQTGQSVNVELRPIDGPITAGSRISLPAMRALNAPLTALPVLTVFAVK